MSQELWRWRGIRATGRAETPARAKKIFCKGNIAELFHGRQRRWKRRNFLFHFEWIFFRSCCFPEDKKMSAEMLSSKGNSAQNIWRVKRGFHLSALPADGRDKSPFPAGELGWSKLFFSGTPASRCPWGQAFFAGHTRCSVPAHRQKWNLGSLFIGLPLQPLVWKPFEENWSNDYVMRCALAVVTVINSYSSSFMECACLFFFSFFSFSPGIILMLDDTASAFLTATFLLSIILFLSNQMAQPVLEARLPTLLSCYWCKTGCFQPEAERRPGDSVPQTPQKHPPTRLIEELRRSHKTHCERIKSERTMAMLIAWQAFTQHSEAFFSSWLCPALSLPARRQVYNGITLAVALCPFAKRLLLDGPSARGLTRV